MQAGIGPEVSREPATIGRPAQSCSPNGAIMIRFAFALSLITGLAAAQPLDFEVYRTKVEPIFAKKRTGHARCVACHEASNSRFKLEPLPQGATTWTEEQSRKNFESVLKVVA